MRRRFFIEQFEGEHARMIGETAHHLGRVLRAQPGQMYELSDGKRVFLGKIQVVRKDEIDFTLLEELEAVVPEVATTLLLCVVKFDAFEWALEKATELGVSRVVPVAAARSDKALVGASGKRADRWRKILLEASQQSRRVSVPVLANAVKPVDAFSSCSAGLKVMLSERQTAKPLRKVLEDACPKEVCLATGPEGGWTEEEFEFAGKSGFVEGSLGKLILRTETAVIAALANLNFALER